METQGVRKAEVTKVGCEETKSYHRCKDFNLMLSPCTLSADTLVTALGELASAPPRAVTELPINHNILSNAWMIREISFHKSPSKGVCWNLSKCQVGNSAICGQFVSLNGRLQMWSP